MSITNFWKSSQYNSWMKNFKIYKEINITEQERLLLIMRYIKILKNIGEHLKLLPRVIGTSIVYLKRFYQKNTLKGIDPIVLSVCSLLLSSKVEESSVTLKNIITPLLKLFYEEIKKDQNHDFKAIIVKEIGIVESPKFMEDVLQLEHLLLEELDFQLTVFHPFKPLKLFLENANMKLHSKEAYTIINDTYYSDLLFEFPPYLIALATIYITGNLESKSDSKLREWFDDLNVNMKDIGKIVFEIFENYQLMKQYNNEKFYQIKNQLLKN